MEAEQPTQEIVAPPAMPRRGGRNRTERNDDDDDENETVAAVVTAPKSVSFATPAPPTQVRAKAPSAAAAAVGAMHADPVSEARPKAPAADLIAAAAAVGDEQSAAAGAAMSAAEPSTEAMEELFSINYDTLAYAALLDLMKRFSRQTVEELTAQREQTTETSQMQVQLQRVERFLDSGATGGSSTSPAPAGEASSDDPTDGYRYSAMLTRLFDALNRNNEGSALTERNQLPVPILERMGKKKTVIANFGRICDAFHRPIEDVKDFIEKELSIRGNIDSNKALILKFEIRKQTDFDRVLIKYLDEYVKCNSCHRIDTTLTKDGRRLELRCNVCTATRTVTAATSATFSAVLEKRSRQRAMTTL